MKEKWTPHIIAVMALVVFIGLGLACATLTPEEQAARQAEREARATTRRGGSIMVKNNDPLGRPYLHVIIPSNPQTRLYMPRTELRAGNSLITYISVNGEYIIHYIVFDRVDSTLNYMDESTWRTKTVSVSNGERVEVNIP